VVTLGDVVDAVSSLANLSSPRQKAAKKFTLTSNKTFSHLIMSTEQVSTCPHMPPLDVLRLGQQQRVIV
jgi:hypothetical protein